MLIESGTGWTLNQSYEFKVMNKVEEPIRVRVVIRILKIFPFLILQSPKSVTLLLEVETRPFHIRIGRKSRPFHT
jgi:hypothetical protein